MTAVTCDEREYARLLGYPWGTPLEGDVRECAGNAVEWYRRYGKPKVYCSPLGKAQTVVAITAGMEVDEETDRLWKSDRVAEAYFLDRYAAAVVEKLAADFEPRRSPGTAGMRFEEQWRLFSYIAPLKPQMEILPSGMLRPKNSLLAIVGPHPRHSRNSVPLASNPCNRCGLSGCTFRRRSR